MLSQMPAETRDIVLSVRDLVVQYPQADGSAVRVLDGISFDVYRGETLVIMGGSGCGKSTLLNCLIGELEPHSGSITYFIRDAQNVDITQTSGALLDRVRRRFGILFQSGALFSSMTVGENIALPLREHSSVDPTVIDIVVTLKLQQVHMLPHRDKLPAQLSGGQKKRAGLARATALDPEILFYDEPSAGLDPVTSSAIDQLILDHSIKLQVTSIVVTHEMDSAFRIANRMIMLERGKILRVGTRDSFDALRDASPGKLPTDEDRRIHQFLTGSASGPLTDEQGLSLYEQLLIGGEESGIFRHSRAG